MNNQQITEIMESYWYDRWLLNGKYKWEFIDAYTFTDFKKEENSPSLMSSAIGNASFENRKVKALLEVQKNESGKLYMSLFMSDPKYNLDREWNRMITIVDAERTF